jgi:hypothetical protein
MRYKLIALKDYIAIIQMPNREYPFYQITGRLPMPTYEIPSVNNNDNDSDNDVFHYATSDDDEICFDYEDQPKSDLDSDEDDVIDLGFTRITKS